LSRVTDPGALPPVPYTNLQLQQQTLAAQVYSGVDVVGTPTAVIVLTPAGLADPAVRNAFEQMVNASLYGTAPGPVEVHAADLTAPRPWAASGWSQSGRPGVAALLPMLPAPSTVTGYSPSGSPTTTWSPAGSAPPYPLTAPPAWSPPGSAPATTSRTSSGVIVAIVAAILAVLVLGGGAIALVLFAKKGTDGHTPVAGPSAGPSAIDRTLAGPTTPAPNTAAPSPSTSSDSTKPSLRSVPARSVVGPTFGPNEETYTMAFPGWPFAFRTPKTWGCLGGNIPKLPDAKAWVCIDEQHPEKKQKVNVMFRACPTTCTPAERQTMNNAWFDEPTKARQGGDDRTSFVETQRNSEGFYTVDFSRFFSPEPGQPLKWQVGVFVKSPPETAGDVQKILNDIASQTP
jgi:hypothetical protein